jgi:hypothetical protein
MTSHPSTIRAWLLPEVVLAGLVLGLLPAVTQAAETTIQATYYVAPTGSGTACTQAAPCGLATAKAVVESQTASMTGDLVVNLQGGTYVLASELTFDTADSGHNGHQVVYQAVPGQEVVFSGGQSITGWTLYDAQRGIYRASVPPGLDTRQLYVNGRRASVASRTARQVFGNINKTSTTFTFSDPGPNGWTDANRVDLVFGTSNLHWAYFICPVSSISAGTITMADPCWDNVRPQTYLPTLVENNLALLINPGDFYTDPAAGKIYYIPRAGEDLSTATTVAARLQSLLTVEGASSLRFSGITFAHATWLFDSQGVVDRQANVLATTDLWSQFRMMPAAVTCHSCSGVTFSDNTFAHLGATALALDGAGTGNTVSGNVVTDVSGNGIQIGDVGSAGDGKLPGDGTTASLESGDTIENNYVHDVANEYLGGVGILAAYVKHTTIAHNEVWHTPYTGISLGWGWGLDDPGMVDNHVDHNRVHDVMTSSLLDGAAIYVNGTQGTVPPPTNADQDQYDCTIGTPAISTIQGNYVAHSPQNGGGIYLDNGASNWLVKNNVVDEWVPNWLNLNPGYHSGNLHIPAATYNEIVDNDISSTVAARGVYGQDGAWDSHGFWRSPAHYCNTFAGSQVAAAAWSPAAEAVIASAGLDPDHIDVRGGDAISNVAYHASTSASSTYSSGGIEYSADRAVSGKVSGNSWLTYAKPFASEFTGSNAWWQVDLGDQLEITGIQVLFRQDQDMPEERSNFEIWVSNNPDVNQAHTVACSRGADPLGFQARYACPIAGKWRYVLVVKTDAMPLVLQQVRVYGVAKQAPVTPSPTPGASLHATTVTALHEPGPSRWGSASSVRVTVASDDSTGAVPTGVVRLIDHAGTVVSAGDLAGGAVDLPLPSTVAVGAHTLTATYDGATEFAGSQAPVDVQVVKRSSTTKPKRPRKRPSYRTDFKVKVTVKASGPLPTGKVKIAYRGKRLGRARLRRGKAVVKITKDLEVGRHRLLVKYLGSSTTLPSRRKVTIVIVKT